MRFYLSVILFAASISGCRKFLEPSPPSQQVTSQTVFSNESSALAALVSIYAQMEADGLAYHLIAYTGLSADEMKIDQHHLAAEELYDNNLRSDNPLTGQVWTNLYKYIYQANAVIDGVRHSSALSASLSVQLDGEARFLRAFCLYHLSALFGGVPLVTSTDYRTNERLPRSPLVLVYAQIKEDLEKATLQLHPEYAGPTAFRVRANKPAAQALMARLLLLLRDWQGASMMASAVLSDDRFALEESLQEVFQVSSKEAILQLQSVSPRLNSYPGAFLLPQNAPTFVSLSPVLLQSFEPGDLRRRQWIDSIFVAGTAIHFPFKYRKGQNQPGPTEFTTLLRLAELYLIRAEARVESGDLTGAANDVNIVRRRAGLQDLPQLTRPDLLRAIAHERRHELFTEMGDRWLYLNQRSLSSETLSPVKGSNWTTGVDELYPIPRIDVQRNTALHQNPGY